MKVLRISSLPTMAKPGAGLAALRLAQIKSLENVVISYKVPDDQFIDEVQLLKPYLLDFDNPVMPRVRSGRTFLLAQVKRSFAILMFSVSAIRIIGKESPDIIHLHSPMHFLVAWWAALRGISAVLTFHGTDFNRVIESKFYQLCLKPVLNINCVSSHQVEPLQRIFPDADVTLVGNGADLDLMASGTFRLGMSQTILAVGTLRWHKGFSDLVNVFSEIANAYPGWRLRIIGEGPERAALEAQVQTLGLEGRVELPGSLSRTSVANEFRDAEIFVVSSVTEGLPKVLLEAMRAKCGCVSYEVGDCSRVLGGAGVLVSPQDSGGLRAALSELIESPELRYKLGELAYERAGCFSWDAYQQRHVQQYYSILGRR